MQTTEQKWELFLQYIKDNIEEQSFNTWFKPVKLHSFDGKKLRVMIPSEFFYEYWESHFIGELRSGIRRYFGDEAELIYVAQLSQDNDPNAQTELTTTPGVKDKPYRGANKAPDFMDGLPTRVPQELNPHLNPLYLFENFIEGDSNKFPRLIGQTIAEKYQDTFNPFFIYGPSGVGKTHLANAIGARMKELCPQKRVLYVSAHLLLIQFTDSVKQNKFNDFMNFYQSIDALIVDDIQEISGKEKTQEAFFNIFNHLQHNHRQLIITCDRPPVQLEGVQERLISRFNWGIIAELERPDAKLRHDIVEHRVNSNKYPFPKNVINYIASNVTGSIRELEGVISSLLARSLTCGCEITMELAMRTIAHTVKKHTEPLTTEQIVTTVCKAYNVKMKEVLSSSRKRDIAQARQVSMYFAQKHTDLSSAQIGIKIGGRDHSTVLHSCNLVEQRMGVDKQFRKEVEDLERQLLH